MTVIINDWKRHTTHCPSFTWNNHLDTIHSCLGHVILFWSSTAEVVGREQSQQAMVVTSWSPQKLWRKWLKWIRSHYSTWNRMTKKKSYPETFQTIFLHHYLWKHLKRPVELTTNRMVVCFDPPAPGAKHQLLFHSPRICHPQQNRCQGIDSLWLHLPREAGINELAEYFSKLQM